MQESVSKIKGVGEKTYEYLTKAGIYSMEDLLFCMPKRYNVYVLKDIFDVSDEEIVCIKGYVDSSLNLVKFRGNLKSAIFYFTTSNLRLRVFGFGMEYLKYNLKKGRNVILYGKYNKIKNEFVLRNLFFDDFKESVEPIYGIKGITNKQITKFLTNIYEKFNPAYEDEMPEYLKEKYRLISYNEYLYKSHFPRNSKDIKEITRRKKYQEYLEYSLGLYHLSYVLKNSLNNSMKFDTLKLKEFIDNLSFELTNDQKQAMREILKDLESEMVMNRILCGDTGSGKTIVALIAAYATTLAGYQSVLMVPSEVLSFQHYDNAKKILGSRCNIVLLNGTLKKNEREEVLERIKSGSAQIIIGTQSLIGEVEYHHLGLCIIDEQHRFGVAQRAKLINKGKFVNSLFLSATPIPRSLMISEYGGLSLSTLKVKPNGRKQVMTKICDINDLDFVISAINKNISKGFLVFVVVPKINDSDDSDLYSINMVKNILKDEIDGKVDTIHSLMPGDKKNHIMQDFMNHKINVLISTTVIEVGVDIKDATLMVVFNAEMFGLSTLHQLRGRVGRNDIQSGCILLTNDINNKRLKIIESNYDSFELSEADLSLRGPGEILGLNQSGDYNFNEQDNIILKCAKDDAPLLYENHIKGVAKYFIVDKVILQIKDKNINLN